MLRATPHIKFVFLNIFVFFFYHDDVIKWKHLPRYWPFVRGIPRSQVNSPHKGQWRRVLMFSLICAWINGCVNNREAGDLRWRQCNEISSWPVPFFKDIFHFYEKFVLVLLMTCGLWVLGDQLCQKIFIINHWLVALHYFKGTFIL